jgi:hypothetical protein
MDQIHALGAAVSLAAAGARAIKGGNWNLFAGMLKDARADVQLATEVSEIMLCLILKLTCTGHQHCPSQWPLQGLGRNGQQFRGFRSGILCCPLGFFAHIERDRGALHCTYSVSVDFDSVLTPATNATLNCTSRSSPRRRSLRTRPSSSRPPTPRSQLQSSLLATRPNQRAPRFPSSTR